MQVLAMNMAPIEYEDGVLSVIVDVLVADLYNPERQLAIEMAVSKSRGHSVTLKVRDDADDTLVTETPADNRRRHIEEAKSQAYQNLISDPVVKDVVDRFDATVVSESIKPGNQRG